MSFWTIKGWLFVEGRTICLDRFPLFVTEISCKTKPGKTLSNVCKTTVSKFESVNLAKPSSLLSFFVSFLSVTLDEYTKIIIKQKPKTGFKSKII